MATPTLTFKLAPAEILDVTELEIEHVLTQVYVVGAFTAPEVAASLFEPSAVRRRGIMIAARDDQHSQLAGFIIVVPPNSPARQLAGANEGEVHLLGVLPEYRAQGLGRMLVDAAIEKARELGYSKLILWTQPSMSSAQRLYESAGFRHVDNFERNGRQFKLYERVIVV
jgi:ribosomal protein S18 acetylase RimI-like enzyme